MNLQTSKPPKFIIHPAPPAPPPSPADDVPSRTNEHGARARGQTFAYLPEDLTIVGSERFAAWCREQFGEHGPRVLTDPNHSAMVLFDPRCDKVFEPEWLSGLEALAADVKVCGVEQPIGVHRGEVVNGSPMVLVVYGRRRVLAAAMANKIHREEGVTDPDELVRIEAKVKRGRWEELRLCMLAENDNRENNPPSVQAENVYRAVVQKGQDVRKVANRMGKPVLYLERLLDLRECEEAVVRAVDDGSIPLEAVTDLHRLPPKKQVAQAARMAAAPKSPRAAMKQVRAENPEHVEAPKPAAPVPPKKRPLIVAEAEALKKRLTDPKLDAFRRQNLAALQTLRWVLGEADAPSSWKGAVREDR